MKSDAAFNEWIQDFLPPLDQLPDRLQLQSITGDAGFRQYFRSNTKPSMIAVHAPPEHEDVPAFITKAQAFARAGVGVPRVFAVNYQTGFMLQEDLGDRLLLPLLNSDSVDTLYTGALKELSAIQSLPRDSTVFPLYDRELLLREMNLFPEWFIGGLLGIELSEPDKKQLIQGFDFLVAEALAQPQVVVHRDFHSRNLLLRQDNSIGVVDFQDAVIGPFTYDLVSLLKDCYIRWPISFVRRRALNFMRHQVALLNLVEYGDDQLIRWFDLIGLQRHLKVLGIFARLWLRDGKARYLDDLPLVLHYTLQVVTTYSEIAGLQDLFQRVIMPALPGQPWYRSMDITGEDFS